jgi:hypothetical protein
MKRQSSIRVLGQALRLLCPPTGKRNGCPTAIFLTFGLCVNAAALEKSTTTRIDQVPTWSTQDMDFFLHGSMSSEVVPEGVLQAFIKIYSDLFPTSDLSHLGLIPDSAFGWPIGLSRKSVKRLGGLSAVGINCASCHIAQITSTSASEPIRILGATSHFDIEAFFGSILAATFKTSDPTNMKKFSCRLSQRRTRSLRCCLAKSATKD